MSVCVRVCLWGDAVRESVRVSFQLRFNCQARASSSFAFYFIDEFIIIIIAISMKAFTCTEHTYGEKWQNRTLH